MSITIKKFAGLHHLFLSSAEQANAEDNEEQNEWTGSMPTAFHWQASHTPRTGNRVYGGTVNFWEGLINVRLQEFRRANDVWHLFCKDPTGFSIDAYSLAISSTVTPVTTLVRNEACSCKRSHHEGAEPEDSLLVK